MRLVPTIDSTWNGDIERWKNAEDFKHFILGERTIEQLAESIASGDVLFLGLEEGKWRGFVAIEPKDEEAEVTLFAPGNKARTALDLLTKLLSRLGGINKIYMKVQANRLKKWESYNKKDWDRITRFWNLKFVGLVGDPINEKPYYILAAKEIK